MTPLLDMSKILFFIVLPFFFSSCSSNSIDPTGTYNLESETEIRNGDTYGYSGDFQENQSSQFVKTLDDFRRMLEDIHLTTDKDVSGPDNYGVFTVRDFSRETYKYFWNNGEWIYKN